MRRASRTDSNHWAIVKAARKLGCLVHSTAAVGDGFPDIVICLPNRLGRRVVLCEIKNGALAASAQALTLEQVKFHALWPVTIIRSVDDLLKLLHRTKGGWRDL